MKDEVVSWACKNYDGDVMSDMVASAFGSLAMMTSVLVSPTVISNTKLLTDSPEALLQASSRRKLQPIPRRLFLPDRLFENRGELDGTPDVVEFAQKLEESTIETIESGIMTGDIARISEPKPDSPVGTEEFIDAIALKLQKKM